MPVRHLAYDDVRDSQDPAQLELLHFDPAVRRIAALAAASFQTLAMGRWVNREQCNHYPALDGGHSNEAGEGPDRLPTMESGRRTKRDPRYCPRNRKSRERCPTLRPPMRQGRSRGTTPAESCASLVDLPGSDT